MNRIRTVQPAEHRPRRAGFGGTAFTLMELMVVIVIITILMLIAIPTFSAMMYSTESTTAEGLLRTAIRSGRDAAIRSGGDADAALVFFYEPGGRLTMIPCVKVATLDDADRTDVQNTHVERDIFIPAPGSAPTQLPRNWTVRGFVPAGSIETGATNDWYETGSGTTRYDAAQGNWVFPETGFYDVSNADHAQGHNRQTFMLRFEAGTGVMKVGSSVEALVLNVRPSAENRTLPRITVAWANAYEADPTDYAGFVRRVLTDLTLLTGGNENAYRVARRNVLGAKSADMVLARAVGQVVLCDESRLAAALGVRLNSDTGCLYQASSSGSPVPTLVSVPGISQQDQVVQRINQWVQGDTDFDGVYESVSNQNGATLDQPEARIYAIDRNTAAIRTLEVQP